MKALDAITDKLFDYAGMYPPAGLDFDKMLDEAAKFPQTLARPSIVSADLVIGPELLQKVTAERLLEAGFQRSRHVRICVVGVPIVQAGAVATSIQGFNRASRLEPVPHEVSSLELQSGVTGIEANAAALMPPRFVLSGGEVQVYWEPTLGDAAWNERFDDIWAIIDACNGESEIPIVGLKVRCGGDRALSPATLARILPEVTRRSLPFKATQGLHHALAGGGSDARMGFLGLTVALWLHEEGVLDADALEACLTETDASAFDFEGGLSWRGHGIDRGQLGHAMRTRFNIGSCSMAEPDAELAQHWPLLAANT